MNTARLCRQHHPDLYANETEEKQAEQTRIMQALNAEYAIAMDKAVRAEKPGQSEASYAGSADLAERIRQAIEAVIRFDNIEIEICGAWVWLHGDTYPIKEHLKASGYQLRRTETPLVLRGLCIQFTQLSQHGRDTRPLRLRESAARAEA
jgi:hypothetical protein